MSSADTVKSSVDEASPELIRHKLDVSRAPAGTTLAHASPAGTGFSAGVVDVGGLEAVWKRR